MALKKSLLKKLLLIGGILLLAGIAVVWYIFTEKHTNTSEVEAAFSVSAMPLIQEFKTNEAASNKKYAEQIVAVTGKVTEIEQADTTVNIKMADSTGSYIIFAFQQQNMADAKSIKGGDEVTIKGSCSGGTFSEILEAEYISFKRCVLNKK